MSYDSRRITWPSLAVKDQGIGIPPADINAIFDQFRRGTNVTGKVMGSGIGLARVKQFVEQHGGSIEVESEIGDGSTFTVRLPLAQLKTERDRG